MSGKCAYRGAGGLKCAIGVLIPDEAYQVYFEGYGVHGVRQHVACLQDMDAWLLENLQLMHDLYSPEDWPVQLERIRRTHDLA